MAAVKMSLYASSLVCQARSDTARPFSKAPASFRLASWGDCCPSGEHGVADTIQAGKALIPCND